MRVAVSYALVVNLNRANFPWMHRLVSRLQWEREGSLIMAIVPALCCAASLGKKTPFSIDHPMHLFKAWHFWTEMLARGRLRGWSHFIGFGVPMNELVPCGSDAWVALFRIATFGQLSWPRTYALAFAAFLVLVGFAAYSFARLYFGRGAGVAAAWITTLDPGQMLQGGWEWHTHYGVWPVSLSMAFSLLALVRFEHVLRGGRTRDVFWAGAWLAAALLTHPLALLVFAIATPLLLLEHAVVSRATRPPRVFAVMGALTFGFALAAFYVVPALTHASETQDLGWLGDPLSQVSQHLVDFKTFDKVWAPVHALALLV